MHAVDWLILLAYLGGLTAIGVYFSRRQGSLQEFIRGGGKTGWLAVGVSLMAALNSGMDYIQTPALVFVFGMVYVAMIFTWIPLYPYVTRITVPFYRRLNVHSAYEYLELRFGLGVRITAAMIFVLWRVGWMGVALYVPFLAVKGAAGGQLNTTWIIVVVGAVVTLYTMLGGMKAVIWNDVLQFCVMFGGLFATLAFVVSSVPGGISEVFATAQEAGKLSFAAQMPGFAELDLSEKLYTYFTTEITFIGIVLCILIGRMANYTSDQVAVQRFQTIETQSEAKKVLIVSAVADVVWMMVLGFVGLALFAYFQHYPMPDNLQNDKVLPYFMSQRFPVGLTGLVIASIFASSLSSVDAALNSTTSIIVVDFYNRVWLGRHDPTAEFSEQESRRQLFASRAVNAVLGVIVTSIAANVEQLGEIYTVANKILGAFFGILFGTFSLGMFSRRAHSLGVVLGALAGLCVSSFLSFFSALAFLHEPVAALLGEPFVDFCRHISWQWPPIIGLATTLLTGQLLSLILPAPERNKTPLTYSEVMRTGS